ncbi:MAG: peptidylprolyl isomerase [Limisphaerales bacterium]
MGEVAVISTDYGDMAVELWPEVAPNTVANFTGLANSEFYDGTAIHRVVKGYVIQGGDPLSKEPEQVNRWGTGDPGYKILAEFSDRPHVRGVMSMARGSDPDSAGCQFFICLDTQPELDGEYTCFGQLIAGDEVLAIIGQLETERHNGGPKTLPVERVGVNAIRIYDREQIEM